jgi:hypothetical protein
LTARSKRLLWLTVGAGVAIRIALAFATFGDGPDIRMFGYVGDALLDQPLHVYTALNHAPDARWFYPPGYFPWVAVAEALSRATGLPMHGTIQLAPIAADAAIAWIVQDSLGRRGKSDAVRLGAAATVAFGPSFAIISGYQGQLDSVAILPAVIAVIVWDRDPRRRALVAGLLIGLGGALKIFPLLALLALLPTVRSWREAATLVGTAAAVGIVALAPWMISEQHEVREVLGYSGISGLGGPTLAMQPGFAENFLGQYPPDTQANWLLVRVIAHGQVINLLVLTGVALFLLRCRPRPVEASVLVFLSVYVLTTGFFFQYVIWGLPFFLLVGYVRKTALLQAAYLAPAVIFYMRPWDGTAIVIPFAVIMIGIWVALAVALTRWGAKLWRERPAPLRTAA